MAKRKNSKKIEIKCEAALLVKKDKLIPFQGDLVFSTEDELDALERRIIERGFDSPVNAWEKDGQYFILDGHRRKTVLNRLEDRGYSVPNVPINLIHAKDEKDAKERILGFRSAFGRITQDGFDEFIGANNIELNTDIVRIDSIDMGVEIDLDFDVEEEINGKNADDYLDDLEHDFPEKNVYQFVKYGDIIKLGSHKIFCGMAHDKESFKSILKDKHFGICVTEPPVNRGELRLPPGYRSKKKLKNKNGLNKKEYKDLMLSVLNIMADYSEIDSPVFWKTTYDSKDRDSFGRIVFSDSNPFTVKETISMEKASKYNVNAKGLLARNADLVFLLSKGAKYKTNQKKRGNDSIYSNIWETTIAGKSFNGIIDSCFPLEFPVKAIKDFSEYDTDIVLDPFIGSGTTLIAAEITGRTCVGIEMDPRCCDAIIYKYCEYMASIGKKANVAVNNKSIMIPYSFKAKKK